MMKWKKKWTPMLAEMVAKVPGVPADWGSPAWFQRMLQANMYNRKRVESLWYLVEQLGYDLDGYSTGPMRKLPLASRRNITRGTVQRAAGRSDFYPAWGGRPFDLDVNPITGEPWPQAQAQVQMAKAKSPWGGEVVGWTPGGLVTSSSKVGGPITVLTGLGAVEPAGINWKPILAIGGAVLALWLLGGRKK